MEQKAARLFHDQSAGRHVPTVDAHLEVRVRATLSHSTQVQSRRADNAETVCKNFLIHSSPENKSINGVL